MSQFLVLCPASSNPRRTASRLASEPPAEWIYLGRDFVRMSAWESALGPSIRRVCYSREFQELASRWRRPFLDWMGAFARRHNSLEWWGSRIAERNTMLDSLYHRICYLGIARECVCSRPSLLVVAESRAVLDSIAIVAEISGSVRRVGGWALRRDAIVSGILLFLKWGRYCWLALVALAAARWTRICAPATPLPTRPCILFHSCMDEGFFERGHDNYFTTLPEELRRRGHDVRLWVWPYNLRRPLREAFAFFRRTPERYLIPEDYYRLSDYLWAAAAVWRQYGFLSGKTKFEGMDISLLTTESRRFHLSDHTPAYFLRYYRLIERLAESGFQIAVFIDTFENMITEKASVAAFRRFMPTTRTVGYQPWASPAPLFLCTFTSEDEAALAPYPDVIVCQSSFTASLFEREGYPRNRIRVGPSLRYGRAPNTEEVPVVEERAVLAVCPLDPVAAAEMFAKLRDAFPEAPDGAVLWLKRHPMMPPRHWDALTLGLPRHMVPVDGPMSRWLPRASCALVTSSTTGIEIALAGKPLVQLGRESDFDMDVLAWFPDMPRPAYTREELRAGVRAALALDAEARSGLRRRAADLARQCLSPLNDETVQAFLTPPANAAAAPRTDPPLEATRP